MDRENKFTKIVQGIIRINADYKEPTGARPQIRVVGDVGHIDLWLNNVIFPDAGFDKAVEDLYDEWEKELKETLAVLTPHDTDYHFVRMSPDDLRQLLGGSGI